MSDYWSDGTLKWTNGFCSVFAIAFQQRFGGEIWAVVNRIKNPEDDFLNHCYCVVDGITYDAEGAHTIEYASDCGEDVWTLTETDKKCGATNQWIQTNQEHLCLIHDDCCLDAIPEALDYMDRNSHLFPKIK